MESIIIDNEEYTLKKQIWSDEKSSTHIAENIKKNKIIVKKTHKKSIATKESKSLEKIKKTQADFGYIKKYENKIIFLYQPMKTIPDLFNSGKIFSDKEILEITKKLSEDLSIIHSKDIVHGRIEPKNIATSENNYYIINFGDTMSEGEPSDHISFNLHYTAPELIKGVASKQSDIYSLGCVIYFMATNGGIGLMHNLGLYASKCEIVHNKFMIPAFFPESISPEIKKIISGMIMIDANERLKLSEIIDLCNEIGKTKSEREKSIERCKVMRPFEIPYLWFIEGELHLENELFYKKYPITPSHYFKKSELLGFNIQKEGSDTAKKLLNKCKDPKKRIKILQSLIMTEKSAVYYNLLGIEKKKQGDLEKAINIFKQGLAIDPKKESILLNLSDIFLNDYNFIEAKKYIDRNIDHNPNKVRPLIKKAELEREMHNFYSAEKMYNAALNLAPNDPKIKNSLGQLLMLLGRYTEGFLFWEGRLKFDKNQPPTHRATEDNRLKFINTNINKKVILVYREQGLGDSIQYLRFVKKLKEKGAFVILRINPTLKKLITKDIGADIIITKNSEIEFHDFDFHTSLLSLPKILNIDQKNLSTATQYISYPNKEIDFGIDIDQINIGIIWKGGEHSSNNEKRNVDLKYFLDLAKIPKTKLFSLQLEPDFTTVNEKEARLLIKDLSPYISDMSDTAAIIKKLDIIISVDTAVAHLAGALGHNVWVPIQYTPDYRWGIKNTISPWYPTIKIFREIERKEDGNWDYSFEKIKLEIEALIKEKTDLE